MQLLCYYLFVLFFFLGEHGQGKPGRKRQLAEFVMVLVRLRLGLLQKQISDIFCISQASISKIFTTWITLLYHVFKQVQQFILQFITTVLQFAIKLQLHLYKHIQNRYKRYSPCPPTNSKG